MRDTRIPMHLFRLGIVGVAVLAIVTLVGGAPVDAGGCIGCIPRAGMPPVFCTDGNVYPNICVAQYNCQYDCQAFLVQD